MGDAGAVQHVLDRLEDGGHGPGTVSDAIQLSWRRSADAGLPPDHVAVPFDPDVDNESRLRWAAAPALSTVSADLSDVPVALLLSDGSGHLVERWAGSIRTSDQMDGIGAAPGYLCREELVGTNSIGLSLLTAAPTVVLGHEHYADNLTGVSCASSAVIHPATGKLLGVINATCPADAYHPFLPALVGRVVAETRQRLLDDGPVPSPALRAAFVTARRRAKGPLAAVSANTMFFNTAAGPILTAPGDRALLWEWAERAIHQHDGRLQAVVTFSSGPRTTYCEPVYEGMVLAGALVRLGPATASTASGSLQTDFGWSKLTDSERSIAAQVARGLTNRETAALLFISPHTVDYHLRQIFRTLGVQSRVELARIVERNR
ncbi:LuxR C-terminal-related transcriptional regulator [Kribbella sp. NPDC026611]|uniref:LuxR C-terminal-related transcriptional regulator n=1 Tax=Kribbella sp. NPDC026611 TaxID=3154911 RepID=UPI0033ECF78F